MILSFSAAGVILRLRCLAAQVMLLSRDEMSMLVVSYADVARCLKAAYGELQARSGAPR